MALTANVGPPEAFYNMVLHIPCLSPRVHLLHHTDIVILAFCTHISYISLLSMRSTNNHIKLSVIFPSIILRKPPIQDDK
jgi:hypothetical protein